MHNITYDYLRPCKAKALDRINNHNFIKKETLEIWRGKNATVLPLRKSPDPIVLFGAGGVADCHGNYLDISSIDGRVTGGYSFENPVFKDEKVVYCGYLVDQWGHFLIEAVSRLWYFLKYDDSSIDKYVFILPQDKTREITGNYKEFLTLIGIWDKIEIVNTPTTYREVIVPEVSYYRTKFYSQEFIDIFKAVADSVPAESNAYPEKIFFSRSRLAKAQQLEPGSDALDSFYANNGYTILHPEKISLSKLILYIRNAKICASVSGTLPHNMLFGNNGQQLVIAERNVINNEIQCEINIIKELDVTYIDANIPIYPVSPSYGPFILGYSKMLKKYAEDNHMLPPADEYLSERYLHKCFVQYMKAYRNKYHYQWYMDDWFIKDTDSLYEGYEEGKEYFGDYLRGIKPFLPSQHLTLNPAVRTAKRILRMIKK